MPGNQHTQTVISFGPFQADLQTQELRKNGVRLRLPGQSFQILKMLLERPGELITREELHKALWPSDTYVDFEHGVNAAVNRLREVLGDSADSPQLIETLPRRGYRFIGKIDVPQTVDRPETRRFGSGKYRTAFLLLLLCAAGILFLNSRRLPTKLPLEVVPLTSLPGHERAPTFSPEGEQIAFDYENESGRDIFTKRLDGEKMQRLTDPPGDSSCPSWSPDGKWIAYLQGASDSTFSLRSGIYLMNPLGGAKRRLLEVQNVSCRVSWSPDSRILVYGPGWSDVEPGGLFLLDIDNPIPRRLLTSPPNTVDASPVYSRDGKSIAFVRSTSLATNDIYVVPSSGGEPKRLTILNANLGGPVWTPDDKRIIFWGTGGWNGDLYAVPSTGGPPQRLPFGTHNERSPIISQDGSKLAYVQFQFDPNIWRLDLSEKASSPTKFIASTWFENAPDFSADGSKLSFVSERDGTLAIWICNADGSNLSRLIGPDRPNIPRWAPSADRIAFDARNGGHHQIFVVDPRGGTPRQVTFGEYESQAPSWSADGKWIYFGSDRSGSYETWKTSLVTKETIQVTQHGGYYAEESLDGRFVFYDKPRDKMATWTYVKPGLYKMPVNGGPEELLIPEATWLWRAGREGIYFTSIDSKRHPTLMLYRFATGRAETLAMLDREAWGGPGGIAISPDGRTFLYAQIDTDGSDLMLVKNGSW
jgi:Tol biopolymer transport system component/DNA-binding winged helix-turn-helix (wHTH) protein